MSVQERINQGDDNFIQICDISSSSSYPEVKFNYPGNPNGLVITVPRIIPETSLKIRVNCRRSIHPVRYYDRPMIPKPANDGTPQEPALRIQHSNLKGNPQSNRENEGERISTKYAIASVLVIFISFMFALYFVYSNFPDVTEEEKQYIKFPYSIEDAKNLGIVLSRYKSDHYYEVMTGVFVAYVFLQTFAIPGSLFLSILSGFLFPFFIALALVCTCSALGASLCFLLSQLVGRRLVKKYFPEKTSEWAQRVEKHHDHLLNYMIFLRVTPFLPNWFINLTAPVLGVPLVPFALGTFIGVAPPSFIAIQGGQTLQTMTESDSTFTLTSFVWLVIIGMISLVPILFKKKLREKIE